ncbi:MAG: hypothetical protein KOO62_12900 [candidate division Zixibacteria bacterium]|nr:hypothetical protein [candidate division Zixibacteria bacterium]
MRTLVSLMVTAGLALIVGCAEETPSRNHIPVLKERIYLLQEAIKSESRAAIDSLLSTDILKVEQGSDSLLSFCWGADRSFAFDRLGDCAIVYTDQHAVTECFVMDSTGTRGHPVRLSWVYQHDLWLLQRFDIPEAGDSLTTGE